MQSIKDKSQKNLIIADLLVSNGHYSQSVHAFYYACLQLMIVAYCKKKGLNNQGEYDTLAPISSTHNWLANEVYALLGNSKGWKKEADKVKLQRRFRFLIDDIKNKRVVADYKEKLFTQDEIENQIGIRAIANEVINILNTRLLVK